MSKPKILVLTSSYPIDAKDNSGIFVEELSSRLKEDFMVFVLTPLPSSGKKEELRNGVRISRYKYWAGKHLLGDGSIMANLAKNKFMYLQVLPFLLFQFIALHRIIKKEKINLIHAHWLIPQALLALIYKKLFNRNLKIIATSHGSDINSFSGVFSRCIIRLVLKNVDIITVVSDALKRKFTYMSSDQRVFVYPMGVNTEKFSPAHKSKILKKKLHVNAEMILFVGSLVYKKGISYLIEAMPYILSIYPEAVLVIIGKGNLENELISITKNLKISDNIRFIGAKAHQLLPKYFATADVFVLPSFSEGWPVVVMEALSSGTIPVVSNIDVFTSHNHKDKLFKIVEKGNPESIAEGLIDALKREGMEKKPEELRNYALNNLDWNIIGEKYSQLIKSLVSEPK